MQPSNKQASTNNQMRAAPKAKAGQRRQGVAKASKQAKAKAKPKAEAKS